MYIVFQVGITRPGIDVPCLHYNNEVSCFISEKLPFYMYVYISDSSLLILFCLD